MRRQGFDPLPARASELPATAHPEAPLLPILLRSVARELPAGIAIGLLMVALIMWSV